MSADDVYKQLMSVADEIGCKFEKDPNKAGVYNITADNKGSKETLTIGMSKEMAQKTGLSKAQGVVQNADDESYKLIASGSDAKVTLGNEFGPSRSVRTSIRIWMYIFRKFPRRVCIWIR